MISLQVSNTKKYLFAIGAVFLIALGIFIPQFILKPADAAGETILGSSSVTTQINVGKHLTGLQISGTGNPTIPINLRANTGKLWAKPTTGVTITTSTNGKALTLTGALNDVNIALATVTYTGASIGSDTVEVSLVGAGVVYYPGNNHLYEFVPNNTLDWEASRVAAAARTNSGLTGYLATITSAEENAFVTERLEGAGWMGGSDAQTEDDWKWVTGPETGTSFWSGGVDGATVDGEYANWAPGDEPNNAGDEDCTQFLSGGTGLWNDLPCTGTTVDGYVVEYGADGQSSTVASKNITVTTALATFDDGDGSVGDPYQVTDCQRFQAIGQDLDAHYELTANIDCTETMGWDGGRGFTPIGYGDFKDDFNNTPFTGTLNGNGFTVDNITILRADDIQYTNPYDFDDNEGDQGYVGVFGLTNNATITDINITNSIIKGYAYVGGLIGFMQGGTLSDSSVNLGTANNSCDPGDCVWARYGHEGGGLVGHLSGGSITNSHTAGPVKGSGVVIGGLVGLMESGSITNSSSSSSIDGGQMLGGAIGTMNGGTASRIFATGNIEANTAEDYKDGKYAGGLIGALEGGVVTQSYATGDVHVEVNAGGGFVGVLFSNPANEITDSYATGDVIVDGQGGGGFVGEFFEGSITRTYASGSVTADSGQSGGFVGRIFNSAIIEDSFAVGEVASGGAFVGEVNQAPQISRSYYGTTTTTQEDCVDGGAAMFAACYPIENPNFFVNYANRLFTNGGVPVWDNAAVWYFDGENLPVLRMGNNNTPSTVPVDGDEDGISTAIEDAAPNEGNGNNDSTPDSLQANVTSFVNPLTGQYVTLEVDEGCLITNVGIVNESANATVDPNFTYPVGMLDFTIDCGDPGFVATVTQFYHGLSTQGLVLRKFNTTNNTYSTISGAMITGTDPLIVSYQVTDGGELDTDGVENGIIVDPAGLALAYVPTADGAIVGTPDTGLQAVNRLALSVTAIVGLVLLSVGIVAAYRTTRN